MLLPETLKEHHQDQFEFHYIYFLPWKNQMVGAIEIAGGKVSCFSAKNNLQLLVHYSNIIQYCKENQIQLIQRDSNNSLFASPDLKNSIRPSLHSYTFIQLYHINNITSNFSTSSDSLHQQLTIFTLIFLCLYLRFFATSAQQGLFHLRFHAPYTFLCRV